jgi:hypothetical protein
MPRLIAFQHRAHRGDAGMLALDRFAIGLRNKLSYERRAELRRRPFGHERENTRIFDDAQGVFVHCPSRP